MLFLTKLNIGTMAISSKVIAAEKSEIALNQKALIDTDLVRSYLRDIGRVPLLSHEQEITLGRQVQELMSFEKIQKDLEISFGSRPELKELADHLKIPLATLQKKMKRGERAKERMVSANLRLVVSVAKKYTKRNMELLDLIQEGTIGLVRGVEKFDPSRGYKFSTYAYWWIRQGITRAISEKSRAIRLPIHINEMLNKLKKGQRELSQSLYRTPTLQELSDYVDISLVEVKELMVRACNPVSLETKVGDGEDSILLDLLPVDDALPDQQLETNCMKDDIEELIYKLPDMQQRVIKMRFGIEGNEPMTLTGIGRILGISRDRVRNLQRDGLKGLRQYSEYIHAYMAC